MEMFVLESNLGWRVVLCAEVPRGGIANGNWMLVQDGLEYEQACAFKHRFNN